MGRVMSTDWQKTIISIYQILQMTTNTIKALKKIRRIIPKEYSVADIKDGLETGELHFGDKINVVGTFSEYLPFIDPKFMLRELSHWSITRAQKTLPRTVRLEAIDDTYCGALFPLYQKDAFPEETIPIFYSIDSRLLEHFSGEMLEMKCKITQVPVMYRNLISRKEFFTFQKEENVAVPFGLQVLNVEPYGLVGSFEINAWLIGNLNPLPRFKSRAQQQSCFNCKQFFSFMTIDPPDYPPRYGCSVSAGDAPDIVKKGSKEFLTLEKKGIPYVIFPDPFRLFEVFYPSIDLYNEAKRKHVHNILVSATKQNLEQIFMTSLALPSNLEIPEKIETKVDFQYDQRKKFAEQVFDPADVPVWGCPNYEPEPKERSHEN